MAVARVTRLDPRAERLATDGEGLLYLRVGDQVAALDVVDGEEHWRTTAHTERFSAWTQSGDHAFVACGDLVTVEAGHLVRRSAANGEVILRYPFDGQLFRGSALGPLAILTRGTPDGGLQIDAVDLDQGTLRWSLADLDGTVPEVAPRAWHRQDPAAIGDVIATEAHGPGIVVDVGPRTVVAAFEAGGRSVPYRGPVPATSGPVLLGARPDWPPRRLVIGEALGHHVVVGASRVDQGDRKVKGVEFIYLVDPESGRLFVTPAPAMVECIEASAFGDAMDHAPWAGDAHGVLLASRGGSQLYEMDAAGHLRWTAPSSVSPLDVAVADAETAVALTYAIEDPPYGVVAVSRTSGEVRWSQALEPPFEVAWGRCALAAGPDDVWVAWADREIHLRRLRVADGQVLDRIDRTGLTLAQREPVELEVIPTAEGPALLVETSRGLTLVSSP